MGHPFGRIPCPSLRTGAGERIRSHRHAGYRSRRDHCRFGCNRPADRSAPALLSWADPPLEGHWAYSAGLTATSCSARWDDRGDPIDQLSADRNRLVDRFRTMVVPNRFSHPIQSSAHLNATGPTRRADLKRPRTVPAGRRLRCFLAGRRWSRSQSPWAHRHVRSRRTDVDQGPQIPAGAENQEDCVVPCRPLYRQY
jgi:hypothetical protein